MDHFEGTASGHISAPPHKVFALITDIDRLPEWNSCIRAVVEKPASLTPGGEWLVKIRVPGLPPWTSRSRVEEYDAERLRFTYRSRSDDGNPSYIVWTWALRPDEGGGTVATVGWKGSPKTFWRRVIFSHIRKRQLENEVTESIASLERVVGA